MKAYNDPLESASLWSVIRMVLRAWRWLVVIALVAVLGGAYIFAVEQMKGQQPDEINQGREPQY